MVAHAWEDKEGPLAGTSASLPCPCKQFELRDGLQAEEVTVREVVSVPRLGQSLEACDLGGMVVAEKFFLSVEFFLEVGRRSV